MISSGNFLPIPTEDTDKPTTNELHSLPMYRSDVTKKMKYRLQKLGHRNFGMSSDTKQILT